MDIAENKLCHLENQLKVLEYEKKWRKLWERSSEDMAGRFKEVIIHIIGHCKKRTE